MVRGKRAVIKIAEPGGYTGQKGRIAMTDQKRTVTNTSDTEIAYEASVLLMDDELREELHLELAPCTDQEFFTAYEKAHEEKFGEEWELSKVNPIW